MQNKGFVKFLAIALMLICLFYISFTVVVNHIDGKAAEMKDVEKKHYLDSLDITPFYKPLYFDALGSYNLKECREKSLGLGLDLQGGMNVILEVSVPDVIQSLADNSTKPAFVNAMAQAKEAAKSSSSDFFSLFIDSYKKVSNGAPLAEIFATQKLKEQINTKSSDNDVEKVVRDQIKIAIDNSERVLRTRIDAFGVVQPNIQKFEDNSGRIMVELPGVKEQERVRELLKRSANLEFWETYNESEILPDLQELDNQLRLQQSGEDSAENKPETNEEVKADTIATDSINADTAAVAPAKTDVASTMSKKGDGAQKKDEKQNQASQAAAANSPLFSHFVNIFANGGGCAVGVAADEERAIIDSLVNSQLAKNILKADMKLMWSWKADETPQGKFYTLYAIKVNANMRAPLTGDVVVEAKDEFNNFSGAPEVSMVMNSEGARKWADLTNNNINRCVAIVLDGLVCSAPNVNDKIDGGRSSISGHFTPQETKDLANVLQSGKMPARAEIVQEEIVGPSLGQQSINQGIMSFIVAFIILMIYMCMMYGMIPGMVANCALLVNLFFTIGILASFQAALTMSGIAGIVLTLGMAVDANVLIYERTKEEMAGGKNVKAALAAGYSNAFSAIFDSNLTSIITGIILFNFGTGPIKGFATTLIIGIVCSFFTAVWLTRIVYEHYHAKGKWEKLTFVTRFSKNLMKNTKYRFMSSYKKSFTVFGIFLILGIGSLFLRGLSKSIDFTGGRNFTVQTENKVEPEEVRALLDNQFEGANTQVIAIQGGNQLRISTNYKIDSNDENIDGEIERQLFKVLKDGKILGDKLTFEQFADRDNHEGGSIITSQKVGPSIAKDITYSAIWSVALALVAIFIYILLRFRNVAYSVGSVIALTIDTLLILGTYSLCWGWIGFSLEVDQTFIGAILTAIGYSINDKVVVFDRVRENFKLFPKRDVQRVFNDSLNQTLARTINTSVSTLIVLLSIFVLGGDSIRSFAFAMILGVCFGTCSSLFVASPIAYLVMGRKMKETDEGTEIVTEKK